MAAGQLGKSKVIGNWEDKAQRVLLSLLLQCALSMVMKGQRDGEPSCSSPDCVQDNPTIRNLSRYPRMRIKL
ncbi:hypothetical protein OsI_05705 [Oryza sativa Indica Group]|uniref:Uncharacterized protein n=2 Tax=Oryza sativa TaxID=4530 RepID=A3A2R5_ORYSJ|nr:hypothetical protein OsI_05705 [Oryza sativa Indica Group]EAZ21604.1 hypothetical protein OsJ_05232 [Oryza sativa Japonica Group]